MRYDSTKANMNHGKYMHPGKIILKVIKKIILQVLCKRSCSVKGAEQDIILLIKSRFLKNLYIKWDFVASSRAGITGLARVETYM